MLNSAAICLELCHEPKGRACLQKRVLVVGVASRWWGHRELNDGNSVEGDGDHGRAILGPHLGGSLLFAVHCLLEMLVSLSKASILSMSH
jgi:hypothetical protein